MTPESSKGIHPREVELALKLKEHEIPWEVQTGDWFYAQGRMHVVMRVEREGEKTVLYGVGDNPYALEDTAFLPRAKHCRDWLHERGWDVKEAEPEGDRFKTTIHRRQTDYTIVKTEPTELSAYYAAMCEALDLEHFGWI